MIAPIVRTYNIQELDRYSILCPTMNFDRKGDLYPYRRWEWDLDPFRRWEGDLTGMEGVVTGFVL